MKQNMFFLVFSVLMMGCANSQMNRDFVNDPLMTIQSKNELNGSTPFTNLTQRGQSAGGQGCSVCAH